MQKKEKRIWSETDVIAAFQLLGYTFSNTEMSGAYKFSGFENIAIEVSPILKGFRAYNEKTKLNVWVPKNELKLINKLLDLWEGGEQQCSTK